MEVFRFSALDFKRRHAVPVTGRIIFGVSIAFTLNCCNMQNDRFRGSFSSRNRFLEGFNVMAVDTADVLKAHIIKVSRRNKLLLNGIFNARGKIVKCLSHPRFKHKTTVGDFKIGIT